MLSSYYALGKRVIDCDRWINHRRIWVFVARALLHQNEMKGMAAFFAQTRLRQEIIEKQPDLYTQLLRQVLYKDATTRERYEIIIGHFALVEKMLGEKILAMLYKEEQTMTLWQECLREHQYAITLRFSVNEIREGLLMLEFTRDGIGMYHMNFSFVPGKDGAAEIFVGALHGHRGAGELYKDMTKAFFGYRPKNIILYGLRQLAEACNVKSIRVISNYGFQANNHRFRKNRKLKTSLDDFWLQVEGTLQEDPRFFCLPVHEYRKNLGEVVTHKRNLYRKRYVVLDQVAADLRGNLAKYR